MEEWHKLEEKQKNGINPNKATPKEIQEYIKTKCHKYKIGLRGVTFRNDFKGFTTSSLNFASLEAFQTLEDTLYKRGISIQANSLRKADIIKALINTLCKEELFQKKIHQLQKENCQGKKELQDYQFQTHQLREENRQLKEKLQDYQPYNRQLQEEDRQLQEELQR